MYLLFGVTPRQDSVCQHKMMSPESSLCVSSTPATSSQVSRDTTVTRRPPTPKWSGMFSRRETHGSDRETCSKLTWTACFILSTELEIFSAGSLRTFLPRKSKTKSWPQEWSNSLSLLVSDCPNMKAEPDLQYWNPKKDSVTRRYWTKSTHIRRITCPSTLFPCSTRSDCTTFKRRIITRSQKINSKIKSFQRVTMGRSSFIG